jgi:hypothetical protein
MDNFVKDRRNIAMISDIRSTPSADKVKGSEEYEKDFEKHVFFDMDLQKGWYKRLDGPESLLKFRLPYAPGKTKYLCGSLYVQSFPPIHSTELRLIPNKSSTDECEYDNTTIEEQMFYFNTIYRGSTFYDKDPLFGKNYDTLREYMILKRFLEYRKIPTTEKNVFNMMRIIDEFFGRTMITDQLFGNAI